MIPKRMATKTEILRKFIYKTAYIFVAAISVILSLLIFKYGLLQVIIDNASTLAVTGTAISAFLFTIQSVLISAPKENIFMLFMRKHGNYLIYLHRFCSVAEISFMVLMIPMLFMKSGKTVLNLFLLTIYIWSLLFTIWSMYLMGRILIACEQCSD